MGEPLNLSEPNIDAESVPFYAAAAQGRFLLRRCSSCNAPHWYPRSLCPFCGGPTEWVESGGRGTIYSFSIMRRATPPYVIAYFALADGVTMLSNIVDCDFGALRPGLAVKLVFKQAGEVLVPCFTPDLS